MTSWCGAGPDLSTLVSELTDYSTSFAVMCTLFINVVIFVGRFCRATHNNDIWPDNRLSYRKHRVLEAVLKMYEKSHMKRLPIANDLEYYSKSSELALFDICHISLLNRGM